MPIDGLHSSVQLLSLTKVRELPPAEREEALRGWVAWFNTNRHLTSSTLERSLDEALRELSEESVEASALADLDERFGEWLENAGDVGEGRGPDEEPEDV